MGNVPEPEAMRRPDDMNEKPAELLARISKRYGAEFVALCRMLATMNERDWARAFNLLRETARERLATVEDDIIRHTFHSRPDKAEQLGQFRILYARLIDIAGTAAGVVSAMSGDGPAERVNLFVDLFSAVCAMIGHPETATDIPQELQRSGVANVWPTAAPGRPVDKGDAPTLAGVVAAVMDALPGDDEPRSDKSASPFSGIPPGTPLT